MNVLIIDNQETRLKAMVRVLASLRSVDVYTYANSAATRDNEMYFMHWNKEYKEWDRKKNQPDFFELFLIHGRDDRYKNATESFGERVWYGGYSGRDPQAPTDENCIMRIIEADEGILTAKEAQELISYASKQTTDKPEFLSNASFDAHMESVGQILRSLRDIKNDTLTHTRTTIESYINQLNITSENKEKVEVALEDTITFRQTLDTSYQPNYMRKLRSLRDRLMEIH